MKSRPPSAAASAAAASASAAATERVRRSRGLLPLRSSRLPVLPLPVRSAGGVGAKETRLGLPQPLPLSLLERSTPLAPPPPAPPPLLSSAAPLAGAFSSCLCRFRSAAAAAILEMPNQCLRPTSKPGGGAVVREAVRLCGVAVKRQ
jgi:hypothetical protein